MAVIANPANAGYARATDRRPKAAVMEENEEDLAAKRAELERQVRAGKWLKSGSVATLLDIGRTKAHDLLTSKKIRYKRVAGGTQRLANPEDVIRLLEESRRMDDGDDD